MSVTRGQVRGQRRTAQRHCLAVVQRLVDGVAFAAGFHGLERRHILGHRHYLRPGHFLDQGISFLMIVVRVCAQQDLDVRELESQLVDRLLDRRHVPLVRAVNQHVALRRNNEERTQGPGPHVV